MRSTRWPAIVVSISFLACATESVLPEANATPVGSCDEARALGIAPMQAGQPGYVPQLDSDGDGVACEGDPALSTDLVGTVVQVVIHKSYTAIGTSCIGIGPLAAIQPGSQVALSPGAFQASLSEVAWADFTHSDVKDGLCFVTYRATRAPRMPAFGLRFIGPEGGGSAVYGPIKSQGISIPGSPDIRQAIRADMEFAP